MRECLILGNGPSVVNAPTDLPSFGCNFAPRQPTYYVCIDTHVLTEHVDDIYPLASGAQVTWLSARHEGSSRLYQLPYVRLVSKDTQSFKAEQFMSGLTASYVMLKIAYYEGFQRVHLWGVDHSPAWDHYSVNYHADTKPPIPSRMFVMEQHYMLAAHVYARAGREIINHSNPSRLDMIFGRAEK